MRAYPILRFDYVEEKRIYNTLKNINKLLKENECDEELYTKYMEYRIGKIREAIKESDDEDLRSVSDNFISIYLMDDNRIGVLIYDAIRTGERKMIQYEEKDGKYIPYIEI